MKKTMNDDIFGKLEYNVSWEKKTPLTLWTKDHVITLHLEDLDEEGILTPEQKATWIEIKDNIPEHVDKNLSKIADYCETAFELKNSTIAEIGSNISPTALVIERNGNWYILFDCSYDIEHGIALGVRDEKYIVGIQDEFL